LLDDKGLSYKEINIEEIDMSREQLAELTGGMTVPQIVINNTNIGGFDKLMMLSQSGELEILLNA
jgi:glutaredoxin 3|tara:strand:- start:1429 stop:1623 length:195 start_codon:yes stop_codon:yes gene_type:complete